MRFFFFLSALPAKPTMFFVEPPRSNISPRASRLALGTSRCAPPCRASASEALAAVNREPRARCAARPRAPDDGLPAAVRARSSLAPRGERVPNVQIADGALDVKKGRIAIITLSR